MTFSLFGFQVTGPVIVLGVITGMTYGILAVGLVLVYRANRVINFAHGEIGAFAAAMFGLGVVRWHVPYWIAFVLAMTIGAGVGGLGEVIVVRRLRRAPALMSIVATLGLAQFLVMFALVVNGHAGSSQVFPQPSFAPQFDVGALRVTRAYSTMLFITPLLVGGLALFLRRSRFGLAMRAASANRDAARLSAVRASRMSTASWAIAGAVSAFTAILILPTRGFSSPQILGPTLLLRALTAAVIARMVSLPVALLAGVGVGILEQLVLWNYPSGGLVEVVLFAVILIALLLQPRREGRDEEKGSWAAVQHWPPLSESLRKVFLVRRLAAVVGVVALVCAIVGPFLVTNATAVDLVVIVAFSLVGLSLAVVTGLGGQLSLGQFAIAGVGAVASYVVTIHTGNFFLGFAAAGVVAAAASVAIGLPALHIRGLMLAVTTLGFGLAAQSWLFQQSWMFGEGVNPGRPIFNGYSLDTGKKYYFFALGVLLVGLWLARNVWRSGLGRRLRAVRDNEDGARAFTVHATRVKLQGFGVAGFLAGLGGATYAHALSSISAPSFPIAASINVAGITVLGGIAVLAGPIIGAAYIIGLPRLVPLDHAGQAATAAGWLILILYFPGGIAQAIRPIRDRIVAYLARRGGVDAVSSGSDMPSASAAFASAITTAVTDAPDPATHLAAARVHAPGLALLQVTGITKHYGGIRAVDNVSFTVEAGETVGVIGPNGAGKTTLFELLGGFVRPQAGRVVFAGRDVSRLPPETRGGLGLIRSFQDASLFPTMTVEEVVAVALERTLPTRFVPAMLGLAGAERRREARTRQLIDLMGLTPFRYRQIAELSTGTRRITELACLVALEPTMLLLDEPSSGIAQAETDSLGELLQRMKAHLGVTLVIIEHDMPLLMSLADRLIAMDAGKVLADGPAEDVRADPAVVESYLGADVAAIARSGDVAAPTHRSTERCRGITRAGERCSRPAGPDGLCAQHRNLIGVGP